MDNNVFYRLKNERLRLNLGQSDIADATDVSLKTVQRWEKEVAIPSDKLALLANCGIDVQYVVTGQRSSNVLPTDEVLILEKYRQASPEIKNKMLMLLLSGDSEATKTVVNNQKNSVKGQQIGDNNQQHNHFASQQNSSINIENQHGGSIVGIKNK
ncbi:helix-turn-helix domain-containing protein [Acinetobacter junii]|uniref:Helix-turn-helix domain-containing protein n=1 Tax=Acinetobacter junii TaxID=40215 RepID=A0AAW5R5L1_ACIJU|nr:helix-turn-helix transcriptional regulator [Acinetobacter junii]MCU4395942.1 helix-turn-helix domain-containing protein [Acinetobacter junii]